MRQTMYSETVEAVLRYIKEYYGAGPEFLWKTSDTAAAIHHPGTKKWFAALMLQTPDRVLNLPGEGRTDILNLKCDPMIIGSLVDGKRYLPGYHMNKEHWISVVLDGSLPPEEIFPWIDLSFRLTEPKRTVNRKEKP